jgi:CrcB protein
MRDGAAVLVGGAIGTSVRLGIDVLVPHGDRGFPFSTLLINVVGAFALGVLVARLWPSASSWVKAGLGAGLLGSFTTFSALAVSLVALGSAGDWLTAVVYLSLSLAFGLGAAALGLRLASPRRRPIDMVDE